MNTRRETADWLAALARAEFERQREKVADLPKGAHTVLLIEGCRVVDLHHVVHFMSSKPERGLSHFDFTVMLRGWNPFVALLLPHVGKLQGVPAVESTPEFRESVLDILMNLGRASLLRENAEMLRHGMAECTIEGNTIAFRMSERCTIDHFLDRIEGEKLRRIEDGMAGENIFKATIEKTKVENLDERIRELVFPWRPNEKIIMTGYSAAPDIDQHYFSLVAETTHEGIDEAGIHDDTVLGKITGRDLRTIVFFVTSFHLKHIHFVEVAKKAYPEINQVMSLTIWKPRDEFIKSLAEFTGVEEDTVTTAVDMMTVKSGQESYFEQEVTPLLPMLIEISNNYLLAPISSIFGNPFAGIRMLHEAFDKRAVDNLRKPREDWMISELYHLFLGSRYVQMEGTTRLRIGRKVITDIDAAIYDTLTGELALFQLKWQDFTSNDVVKQRSRARNFVEKVDAWARGVQEWIAASGAASLLSTLRLRRAKDLSQVRLFAIGRSAARFQSYGFELQERAVAAATWRQFVRLRYELGPSDNVLRDLHHTIQTESTLPVKLKPLRAEFPFGGHTIVFENLFNAYDEEASKAPERD